VNLSHKVSGQGPCGRHYHGQAHSGLRAFVPSKQDKATETGLTEAVTLRAVRDEDAGRGQIQVDESWRLKTVEGLQTCRGVWGRFQRNESEAAAFVFTEKAMGWEHRHTSWNTVFYILKTGLLRHNSHTVQLTHFKCVILCFLVYFQGCATIIHFRTFSLSPQETVYLLAVFSHLSLPTPHVFAVFIALPLADISCERSHTSHGSITYFRNEARPLSSLLPNNFPSSGQFHALVTCSVDRLWLLGITVG
jgi:hypothetical protein